MKHGKRMLTGTLLVIIFLINIAVPASAYVYNGYKWQNGYAQYTKDLTIPRGWATSLDQGASAWNNAGANFYFYQISCNNKLYYAGLGSSGPLATTYTTHSGTSISKDETYYNNDLSWSTTGAPGCFDVRSVATHEFGHWLSLDHTTATAPVMYKGLALGQTKRTLTSDDIAGISNIYP